MPCIRISDSLKSKTRANCYYIANNLPSFKTSHLFEEIENFGLCKWKFINFTYYSRIASNTCSQIRVWQILNYIHELVWIPFVFPCSVYHKSANVFLLPFDPFISCDKRCIQSQNNNNFDMIFQKAPFFDFHAPLNYKILCEAIQEPTGLFDGIIRYLLRGKYRENTCVSQMANKQTNHRL